MSNIILPPEKPKLKPQPRIFECYRENEVASFVRLVDDTEDASLDYVLPATEGRLLGSYLIVYHSREPLDVEVVT